MASQSRDSVVLNEGSDLQRRSDTSPLEAAIAEHQGELYAFAYRVLGDREAAEDALQDAFMNATRVAAKGAFPLDRPRPWLYRVVYHCCIDQFRRTRRTIHDSLAFRDDDIAVGDDTVIDNFLLTRELSRRLLSLPDDERAAVVLVDVQGLSYEDTAAVVGVPRGTVASRLNRGRAALRQLLDGYQPTVRRTP